MCLYANAFVINKTKETLKLPEFPDRLYASMDHVVHPNFQDQYKGERGVFLTFHDGHCLCQFKEWDSLFSFAEEISKANDLDSIPIMVFWSSGEYQDVKSVDIDLELDKITEKPEEGIIMRLGISVPRRLSSNIRKRIRILFKSGKIATGYLDNYQEHEDYGMIRTETDEIHFSSRELKHVEQVIH